MHALTEQEFRDKLETTALGIVRDVSGMVAEYDENPDLGYECAVREQADGTLVGLVYMGDLGHWFFMAGEEPTDPLEMEYNPDFEGLFKPVYF